MNKYLRALVVLVAVLVLLPLGAYVVHGLHGEAQLSWDERSAAAEVERQLPAAREVAADERARIVSRLSEGTTVATWQEVRCTLDSVDAGWIVQSYEQQCWLRTVDVMRSAEPRPGAADGCTSPRIVGEGRPAYTSSVRTYEGPGSVFPTSFDRSADSFGGCRGVLAARPGEAREVISGSRPDGLAGDEVWLVLEIETPLTRSHLGCHPWKLPFCERPGDSPDLPDELR
ncbi:hypothetical protein [Nocardioides jishulii]|uniref:Uncharacterized protein n=1 Tax=Nocardioides jishulii TaxID=2575440 RepID=A0A4U2YS95_9ACTN|nr:hypothetical protein [Nocardioides jishulii]QCX28804.1 hypothetical protein FCL41_15660 [Nocardioides jishulii]TKI64299.1 hypothetical protein FC770_03905 [Nocardioides jishulii]